MECLSVDWLHTLSLGIFQDFVGSLVWALVEANVWRVGVARDARLQLSVNRLENELFRFYREQAQQGIQHSRVQGLEPQMSGSADAPRCGLHVGETHGFLDFSLELIGRYEVNLPQAKAWKKTAIALLKMKALCDTPARDCQKA